METSNKTLSRIFQAIRTFFPHMAVVLAILVFFVVNAVNLEEYGQTFDEYNAMLRGRLSSSLAVSCLTERKTLSPSDFERLKTLRHPPFFSMILYQSSEFIREHFKLDTVSSRHLIMLVWATLGLVLLFLLTKIFFDPYVALYSTLFLVFFPRFVANAHYNPKDVPLITCLMATFFFMVRFLQKESYFSAIAAGTVLGLSVSTSLNALLAFPVFFIGYAVSWFQRRQTAAIEDEIPAGKRFLMISSLLVSSLLFCYAAWPLLWKDPLFIFRSLGYFCGNFWRFGALYFGESYSGVELPWHYIPFHVFSATPLLTFGFFLMGIWYAVKDLSSLRNVVLHVFLLTWLFLPIAIRSCQGIERYNEMRHVFMSIPPLVMYAGLGLAKFLLLIKQSLQGRMKWAIPAVLTAVFVYLGVEVSRIHPFEGNYYNESVRIAYPRHLELQFDFYEWGAPYRQSAEWVNQHAERGALIYVLSSHHYMLHGVLRDDLKLTDGTKFDYAILLSSDFDNTLFERQTPIYRISRYNSDILYIFPSVTRH